METTNFETQNPIPNIEIPILPSAPTPNKNIFKILFFIFFGLFLIISSTYLYLWVKSDQQLPNSQTETQNQITETIIPTETQIPTIVTDETQNWKTYTDFTYNYSINYPSNYEIKTVSINSIFVATPEVFKATGEHPSLGANLEITVYDSLSEASNNSITVKTLKDLAISQNISSQKDVKSVTIDGVLGYSVLTVYPDIRIYFQKGNFVYFIYNGSLDTNSIEKQIINTFKFN